MQQYYMYLPGEFHGQRNLAGCSPWGHKESHMTEQPTRNIKCMPCLNLYSEREK